jgi:hypothetical protein
VRPNNAKYTFAKSPSVGVAVPTNKFISHVPLGIKGEIFKEASEHAKLAMFVVPAGRDD